MWARNSELVLAAWLLASAWVLSRGPAQDALVLACGLLVATLALLARRRPDGHLHLLELPVAGVLIVAGWLGAPAPGAQNELAVGLLVAMLSIVPSEASRPPRAWRVESSSQHARRGSS